MVYIGLNKKHKINIEETKVNANYDQMSEAERASLSATPPFSLIEESQFWAMDFDEVRYDYE